MNLDELTLMSARTDWFASTGTGAAVHDVLVLPSLREEDDISHEWCWLPTSLDELDPIYGDSMRLELDAAGLSNLRRTEEMKMASAVLAGVRSGSDRPIFHVGPHDFSNAARGAAIYALRMAVRECLLARPGFWIRAASLYFDGRWPCGFIRGRTTIVVL